MSKTKPGMFSPALTKDDVRRVMMEMKDKIDDLRDRLENGIRYDEMDNQYVLVWTKKEIDDAKREAEEIYNTVFKDLPQDATSDQVECTDDTLTRR